MLYNSFSYPWWNNFPAVKNNEVVTKRILKVKLVYYVVQNEQHRFAFYRVIHNLNIRVLRLHSMEWKSSLIYNNILSCSSKQKFYSQLNIPFNRNCCHHGYCASFFFSQVCLRTWCMCQKSLMNLLSHIQKQSSVSHKTSQSQKCIGLSLMHGTHQGRSDLRTVLLL